MCILQSNGQASRGCGQCDADIREAPLRELRSQEELEQVARVTGERVIAMVPDRIFFAKRVRSSIPFWEYIDAAIVYEGTPERPEDFLNENIANETMDLLFNYSLEESEPNRLYNFYDNEVPENLCSKRGPRRNDEGDCTLQHFIPFNVFRINASLAQGLRATASRFHDPKATPKEEEKNSFRPQYKIQSIGRMWACATNEIPTPPPGTTNSSSNIRQLFITSERCLKERTCIPVGGHSVWSALGRINSSKPPSDRKYLFITAPMDSYALFPELSMGASAEITALAVMMAIAETVASYWRTRADEREFKRQPVYFAFNGQSWGYAGSSQFLKDVLEFRCEKENDASKNQVGCKEPEIDSLKFKVFQGADIQVLNIGQLITPSTGGDSTSSTEFFSHYQDGTSQELSSILNSSFRARVRSGLSLERGGLVNDSDFLTPIDASQSFRYYYEDRLDVLSLTNYRLNFRTGIYHSKLDGESRISEEGQRRPVYEAASAIASAVIGIALGDEEPVQINAKTVDNIITCMTGNWTNCPMAKDYLGDEYENTTVSPGNYAGSYFPLRNLRSANPSAEAKLSFIRAFFAHHNRYNSSEIRCDAEQDCEKFAGKLNKETSPLSQRNFQVAHCARRRCVASDTYTHRAFGSGIEIDDPEGRFKVVNGDAEVENNGTNPRQGDWTESLWDPDIGFCGYVEDSGLYSGVILGVGLGLTLLSFALTYWMDRALFEDKEPEVRQEYGLTTGESMVPPV